ncbi:MAG: Tex family protein [Betaproteobacteria bacterium]
MSSTLSDAAQARILRTLCNEISAKPVQVGAAVALLDEGATVPFIARYRKEVTGGLDDGQLRTLEERLGALRELEERRATVLESISSQGRLTPELAALIDTAETRSRLEDLYLPYRPKRRTRADIARECGLEPLADLLLAEPERVPAEEAQRFIRPPDAAGEHGVADIKAALEGARDILSERFAERPEVLGTLQDWLWERGWLASKVFEDKRAEGENFRDYFDHAEPIAAVPSHRALALFRGRQQGVLSLRLGLEPALESLTPHPAVVRLAGLTGLAAAIGGTRAADGWLAEVLRWCWRVKLLPHFETSLFGRIREAAEGEAIRVFGANLKDLLLAAPAGARSVIGLDPGLRTGVKVAVVDATGQVVDTTTIYPHEPRRDWEGSLAVLAALASRHRCGLVAIGNGTASRETDRLAADLLRQCPELRLRKVMVSEAGASVYSASELAAREMPDLDVTLRGAVSIARRLQDPLAELVKIDPKSIGVGQYQHDVNQRALARALDSVVEDCVNSVGVDLNTASVPLLSRVSGLTANVAQRIVDQRNTKGPFANREALKEVPWLGERAFEQAAGFLRIRDGDNPLDGSAVHPEAYPVVERILARLARSAREVIGQRDLLRRVTPSEFTDHRFGEPTVRDILAELEKPGRDPRGEFVTANFKEGVESIADLKPGMRLQGVVTNVANFGAFVDIGVHQDGLVHVSQLSDRFVRDPREAVKAGQVVSVTVVEVDAARKRIALSMKSKPTLASRSGDERASSGGPSKPATSGAGRPPASPGSNPSRPSSGGTGRPSAAASEPTALGAALARLISR